MKRGRYIPWCTGPMVSVHVDSYPCCFAPDTKAQRIWKREMFNRESVWLSSNGVLLISHGDGGSLNIIKKAEVGAKVPYIRGLKYIAWINQGTYSGPYIKELIKALTEYTRMRMNMPKATCGCPIQQRLKAEKSI